MVAYFVIILIPYSHTSTTMKKWFLQKLGGAAPPPYEADDPAKAAQAKQAELIEKQEKKLREMQAKYAQLQATVSQNKGKQAMQKAPAAQTTQRRSLQPYFPPKTCIINQIHVDALVCMAEYLTPVALLLLSHTCKQLYLALQPHARKARREMLLLHHRYYLQLLCKSSLDQYACVDCNDVHSLDLKDSLLLRPSDCHPRATTPCKSLADLLRMHPGQVQLACRISNKLYYTPSTAHTTFMANLLARFKIGTELKSYERSDAFTAEARIQSEVFILRRQWRRSCWNFDPEATFGKLQVCPHQNTATLAVVTPPQKQHQRSELRNTVKRAQNPLSLRRDLGNCPVCPTDWTVGVEGSHYITLTVYQVLGTASTDSFQYWEAQLLSDGVPLATREQPWNSPRLLYELNTNSRFEIM